MASGVATVASNGGDATTIVSPVAEQQPQDLDLDELLASYDDANAFRALLELWGARFESSNGDACGQVQTQGLSCSYQRGTWTTLRQLDRPVMMTLTRKDGETRLATLIGLNNEAAELSINDAPVSVPINALSDYWFGQFTLIWRPANGSDQAIGPWMQNERVRWLRQSLVALNDDYRPVEMDSVVFDEELKNQLIAFQRKHRLQADGVAGQQTQVIINTLLKLDGTPRLSVSR